MNKDYQTYPIVSFGFLIDASIPVVGYMEEVTDAVCLSHSHPRAQLIYATNGVMKVVAEHQIWVVNPLQGLWLPGGVEHQVFFQKNVKMYSVFIDPSVTSNLPTTSFAFDISTFLKQLLFKIIAFKDIANLHAPQKRVIQVFLDELSLITASSVFLPTSNHPKLRKVLALLMTDLTNKYTLDYYAASSSVSSRTLSRLFVKELGMNYSDWCIRLKLIEAIKRLGEKQSVKEIALDLGYENTSAFIYMFKKNLGKTPSNYISDHQNIEVV
ncbi:AraC family transcriptional regulator [Wenyingzhuangia aestuarii]|uniref:AraC family transcriptional regulator n=1 Tax=Wenyingzhuangia aestuarii TaxID=1647582 RepID=UPI00143C12D6|nr:helix-turn-helix transcriptional regulator [Wenyingzhuangia aestuarii]NJB82219.1 AraC-like DNA-binding protein [Wenyingzhuangia aestuarii]